MNLTTLAALEAIVGADHVSTTDEARDQHSRDHSSYPARLPDAVVWPETTAQVSAILRHANAQRVPVVGWGAGSSIEGNPIPLRGGIVVDFGRMNRILALHEGDFQVTVQAGLFYKDLNHALVPHGLFFAPNPGANASIGGMIANNAAGFKTVRYGATRDNVLALEVVLASGEVVRTGSRSVKQSAGYDLTHLFTGSEGTLGLITEATLRLAPVPRHVSAATAAFPDVEAASRVVFQLIRAGLNPAALELLDRQSVEVLNAAGGFALPASPHLFMEFNGASAASLREELKGVETLCREGGAVSFGAGLGEEARARLWDARHQLFEMMVRHHPGKTWLVTDVAVPISRYPEMVAFAAGALGELGLSGGLIGHAGDGNLHTVVFFPPDDAGAHEQVTRLNDRLVARALSLGGTCTGEHGVGVGKQKYMEAEHGAAAMRLMRAIKQRLDPHGILNPGKVLGEW